MTAVRKTVAVLYLGRLVEVSDGKTLFRAPQHLYTKTLLEAVPNLAAGGQGRKGVEGEIPNPIDPPPGCAFHPRCPAVMEVCRTTVPPAVPTAKGYAARFAVAAETA